VKVGIEHPILGLMTFTLIAAMVVTAIVLLGMVGMNVHDYILKTPVTEGYATCFSFDSGAGRYKYNVSITVANSGRVDLRLEKLYVATEKGLVELTVASQYTVRTGVTVGDAVVDFEIILLGFTRDTELWAGQRGLIRINMVSDEQLYMIGGQYSVIAYLTAIGFEAFAVREARFKVGEVEECSSSTVVAPFNIVRVSRAALYWDTFDTNPIGSRVTLVNCHPPSGHVTSAFDRSGLVLLVRRTPGECALIVQGLVLPNAGTIYVAFTSLLSLEGPHAPPLFFTGHFGAILVGDATGLADYAGGFRESDDRLFIRVKIGGTPSYSPSLFTYTVDFDKWYNGTLALSYLLPNVPGYIAFYASPTTYMFKNLSSTERLTPSYVGLILIKPATIDPSIRSTQAYFDNMLVTVGERPWIVRVEDLQPGWRVVLKDGSGNVIDSKIAAGVFVELNVWGVWIIEGGSIEVYDSLGNLLRQGVFSEILGGDVYRVTG
jgi:hypothetical protein